MDKELEEGKKKVGKHEKKRKKKKTILKIVLTILMTLIILIVMLVGVAVGYVMNKLSKIDYQEEIVGELEINEGIENTGYLNVVLFGVDSRSNEYEENAGSDCIIIVSLNRETKEVKMVSVYRDCYLEYENKKYGKITDIYRSYGAEKAISTLNRNLDLDITEYVTINFAVVVDVVNAVGGIEMEITNSELKYINSYIQEIMNVTGVESKKITKAGTYTLDGVQALAYARIRYDGTDINRTEKMRDVLMKTFDKVKNMNIVQINELANNVLPKVKTTISQKEIISLASGLTQYNITTSIGFPYEWADYQPQGVYYLSPKNLEQNVIELHKELFGEEEYQVSEEVKEISDYLIKKTGIK